MFIRKPYSGDRYLMASQEESFDIEFQAYTSHQKEIDRCVRLRSQMTRISFESDEEMEDPNPKRYNRKYSNSHAVFF